MENFKNFEKMVELSQRIYKFIDKYACIRPDFDPKYDDENEKYTSPDASFMKYCADILKKGEKPTDIWSDYGSGGYRPMNSEKGRKEHDYLVAEINKIIKL